MAEQVDRLGSQHPLMFAHSVPGKQVAIEIGILSY
jgi:hypothetical protein